MESDQAHARERRHHPRIAFNRLVRVIPQVGMPLNLVGINYSVGGVALQSSRAFDPDDRMQLSFRLAEDQATHLQIVGRVVYRYRQHEVYTVGIQFLNLAPEIVS